MSKQRTIAEVYAETDGVPYSWFNKYDNSLYGLPHDTPSDQLYDKVRKVDYISLCKQQLLQKQLDHDAAMIEHLSYGPGFDSEYSNELVEG